MSVSREKREKIKLYMLEHIERGDKNVVAKAVDTFSISKTTVYHYLADMEQNQLIQRAADAGTGKYELVSQVHGFSYRTDEHLEEDRIYAMDIQPLLVQLPCNVQDIWRYAFTEMMNNAIEHAGASLIECLVAQNILTTGILIVDNGVGIFHKIQDFFLHEYGERITLDEAVDALFPGKLTTARESHSGEGIFFTSRAVDQFCIYSDGKLFAHQPFRDIRIDTDLVKNYSTVVRMCLSNTSAKQIQAVFDMYTDPDRGFFKTQIPIAHMFSNGYPVSRSEARRLAAFVQNFEEITLDFTDIPQIGQAFAHELFVVFPNKNPQISINTVHANETVSAMIRRVKKS